MTTYPNHDSRPGQAAVAAVAGLLSMAVVPLLVVRAMDAVLAGAAVKIPASGNPLLATAPEIVLTFFPVWGGLSLAAGAAMLMVAWYIFRGERWARPVAVGLCAIPAVTGAYLSGPIMFFASSNAPIFVGVMLMGLVPYFTLLLWRPGTRREKVADFFLFLMLGVTAAWSFSNGGSSLRMFWARPQAFVLDSGLYGFLLGIPSVWIGVVAALVAIPLLAARRRAGWRLAVAAMLIILAGSATLFITHPGTREFLAGMVMAVVSLGLLLAPGIGRRLAVNPPLAGVAPAA